MKEELTNLFNTLCQIETKGQSSIIMGDCLRDLEQLINKSDETEKESASRGRQYGRPFYFEKRKEGAV